MMCQNLILNYQNLTNLLQTFSQNLSGQQASAAEVF